MAWLRTRLSSSSLRSPEKSGLSAPATGGDCFSSGARYAADESPCLRANKAATIVNYESSTSEIINDPFLSSPGPQPSSSTSDFSSLLPPNLKRLPKTAGLRAAPRRGKKRRLDESGNSHFTSTSEGDTHPLALPNSEQIHSGTSSLNEPRTPVQTSTAQSERTGSAAIDSITAPCELLNFSPFSFASSPPSNKKAVDVADDDGLDLADIDTNSLVGNSTS